jgi:hypothetical protein
LDILFIPEISTKCRDWHDLYHFGAVKLPRILLIDKNSVFGGLKIPRGELCVKEIFHTISGVWVGGPFQRRAGEFGDRGGEGIFNHWGGFSGRFEAPRGTPVPSVPDLLPLPTTEGMPPRGSQGPDEGDRRSGGVERNFPGRIPPAPILLRW